MKKKIVCMVCSKPGILDEKYDAYYCDQCNEWIESKCDDRTCQFCTNRPDKPIK